MYETIVPQLYGGLDDGSLSALFELVGGLAHWQISTSIEK